MSIRQLAEPLFQKKENRLPTHMQELHFFYLPRCANPHHENIVLFGSIFQIRLPSEAVYTAGATGEEQKICRDLIAMAQQSPANLPESEPRESESLSLGILS